MHANTPIEHILPQATLQLRNSILKVLVYFDIFSYPLTVKEIRLFLDSSATDDNIRHELETLVSNRKVYRFDNFYSLQNKPFLVYRRKEGNDRAAPMLAKAHKISAFLYRFPFVRGIGISGSLSKNFADKNADIDFFVITSANRLWIARSFMHLFKKLTFLTGR
ncbi:MAG TPA: hypothetical protein VD996_15945, partial [Chitinophagaceae bacterium]|nr:hypothetical protein [Chitinophagaceae bacterium]